MAHADSGAHAAPRSAMSASAKAGLWAGGLVAGAAAFYGGLILGSTSDIPGNTEVLGVQIGGMSSAEAAFHLESELQSRVETPIVITAYGHSHEVIPASAGLRFDADATASAATARIYNPIDLISRLFATQIVDPVVVVDDAQVDAAVEVFATSVVTTPVEPKVWFDGLTPQSEYGEPGKAVDVQASRGAVVSAFMRVSDPVPLVEVVIPTQVSDASVDDFVSGYASTAISAPVRVVAGAAQSSISADEIAESMTFEVKDTSFAPIIDGEFLHSVIEDDLKLVEGGAKDATFKVVNDVPVIVPSINGEGVSAEDLGAAVITAAGQLGDARIATVNLSASQVPKLTTEEASQLGVKELVSTFTQSVPTIEYMQHNLARAAGYIDGMILMPGQTFSMNKTTENHNPDPDKGYMEGYVIGPGGVFQKMLGGGLSAATTTTWSAAFYAGLEPVQVRQHSRYISRYQPGIEATVAWGYFDMQFKNNTPYAIFITAETDDVSMTVSMYSTKIWEKVTSEIGDFYNIVEPPKIYNETDACAAQTGIEGFNVDYKRLFWKDGKVDHTEEFSAGYLPGPEVICGPDPKKPTKSPSDSGSSSGSGSATPTN